MSNLPSDSPYRNFSFDGDELIAVTLEDGIALPLRRLCEVLGLDADAQNERLQGHDTLRQGLRILQVPTAQGRVRKTVGLHQRYVAFWLATITPSLVRPEVREKLKRYQDELVVVLDQLYGPHLPEPSTASDPALAALLRAYHEHVLGLRLAREAIAQLQQQQAEQAQQIDSLTSLVSDLTSRIDQEVTISAAQQQYISATLRRLAARVKKKTGQEAFGRLFAQFCVDLGVPRYDQLASGRYEEALAWLERKAAELLPDDPDALPPRQEALL